jgi:hypothetical protein
VKVPMRIIRFTWTCYPRLAALALSAAVLAPMPSPAQILPRQAAAEHRLADRCYERSDARPNSPFSYALSVSAAPGGNSLGVRTVPEKWRTPTESERVALLRDVACWYARGPLEAKYWYVSSIVDQNSSQAIGTYSSSKLWISASMPPSSAMTSRGTTSSAQIDRNFIVLFRCGLKDGGNVVISIDRDAVGAGSTRPLYAVSVRQDGSEVERTFRKAVEYAQAGTQAKELIIWWSNGNNYSAKFRYNTDWQPALVPFASIELTNGAKKSTYSCTRDSINIIHVANWTPPIPRGKRGIGFNLWFLSYYDVADEAENEDNDKHEN